jgi:hypothetical protein
MMLCSTAVYLANTSELLCTAYLVLRVSHYEINNYALICSMLLYKVTPTKQHAHNCYVS